MRSKGPTLEEDIALSNIGLDLFGQANGFYEYASKVDGNKSADELAFKRNEREFYNFQISEQKMNILVLPWFVIFLEMHLNIFFIMNCQRVMM